MKYIGRKSLSFVMEIIWLVIMIVNVGALIFMSQNISYYLSRYTSIIIEDFHRAKVILMIILYPCGISALFVELSLRRMFRTLVNKDPFVQQNVNSLRVMGFAMIVISAALLAKIILLNSLMTMVAAFGSILLAAFCFILADVFHQAVMYKQDNELTI